MRGSQILWPGCLEHGYHANGADNRMTVSMNFMPPSLSSEDSFSVTRNPSPPDTPREDGGHIVETADVRRD